MSSWLNTVINADAREGLGRLPEGSVRCCVTSPPYYGLRDYGVDGQIGLEETPGAYISRLVGVFSEVWRVLKDDGVLWIVIGDSYCAYKGSKYQESVHMGKHKSLNGQVPVNHNVGTPHSSGVKDGDLIGIPWMLAFALRDAGWYLRSSCVWSKGNPMPESVKNRCTVSHEYVFMLTKQRSHYYFDADAIAEPIAASTRRDKRLLDEAWTEKRLDRGYPGSNPPQGSGMLRPGERRNKRTVWEVNVVPYKEAHFAVFPAKLVAPCILAGSRVGDVVLDPFMGSGTTAEVALMLGRNFVGVELNADYLPLIDMRTAPYLNSIFSIKTD